VEDTFDNFAKVAEGEEEEAEAEVEAEAAPSKKKTKAQKKAKAKEGPALYELSGDKEAVLSVGAVAAAGKRKREKQSLEERLKAIPTGTENLKRHTDGAMQLTFVPKTSAKKHKVHCSPPPGGRMGDAQKACLPLLCSREL
jgi:hypothetical protein